ncbi:MAG: thioredoxin domain-containing protein [Methanomassiliicoccales archaeon]|nr:thioredoxin domain-containing protein [Methanomassiliicoccales archaeon]
MNDGRKGNRLIDERSPYLLQHAHNPVDWYPWGKEVFETAKRLDRPIFLSIGYSSCHWCHVMERESFEDPEIAKLMNRAFINIKVDREERPDVDSLYMKVCQMMTGGGGWPLTIIMTPDRVPFWAGTYLPRFTRQGMPGMLDLVPAVERTWNERREDIMDVAVNVLEMLDSIVREPVEGDVSSLPELALEKMKEDYEPRHGGFDGERKFPSPHKLLFLLRLWKEKQDQSALDMATFTLDNMIMGGIRDHVGGGFHRYSTDPRWHVPHFETMLNDQALILIALSEAYAATSKEAYKQAAEELMAYVEERLTSPEGAFYSSEDADAAGEEGSYYLWTYSELSALLGPEDLATFKELYDVWDSGNYRDEATRMRSGKNVLHLTSFVSEHAAKKGKDPEAMMAWNVQMRGRLKEARRKRPSPALDDKVLADWNCLMIVALCSAHRYLGTENALKKAERALAFVEERMVVEDDLQHSWREGAASIPAFLDDYACLTWAHLEMYYLTYAPGHLERALALAERMLVLFVDREDGGFYLSREDPALLVRIKDLYDGALPSGNSVAYYTFAQLATLFDDARIVNAMESVEHHFLDELRTFPAAHAMFINGVLMKREGKMLEMFGGAKLPLAGYHPHLLMIMAEHMEGGAVRNEPGFRLCTKGQCLPETNDPLEILKLL